MNKSLTSDLRHAGASGLEGGHRVTRRCPEDDREYRQEAVDRYLVAL